MKLYECKGQWGLVTGASSGIGREFCYQLAAAGMNLILVARRADQLEVLAEELRNRHSIQARVMVHDLSHEDATAEIHAHVSREGIKVRLLCNNAACGRWGRFEATDIEVYTALIRLNITAMMTLCHHFFPDLTTYPSSVIINVSSPAAYQPVPYMAVYAASKAFVQSFSQALYEEWRGHGIWVQTLVPGPTATEFDTKAGAYKSVIKRREPSTAVVTASLRYMGMPNPIVTAAAGTYRQRLFAGLFPTRFILTQVAKMFCPPMDR